MKNNNLPRGINTRILKIYFARGELFIHTRHHLILLRFSTPRHRVEYGDQVTWNALEAQREARHPQQAIDNTWKDNFT